MSEDFRRVEAELGQRGYTRMVFDIGRIEGLLDALGSPQRAYPTIHVAGTNGKTSTVRMIDSLLRAHGLRTGRYTSPHLETVRERITIEDEPVSEERFVEVYEQIAPIARYLDQRAVAGGGEQLTYFDMTTAMALAAFADAPVDVAVIEVGLGGAEDSTNVLHSRICVITPIGLDHTEWLGDRIEDIALAKAGIIHPGATTICAVQPEEAMFPLVERCTEVGAALLREGAEFGVLERAVAVGGQVLTLRGLGDRYDEIFLPLHGAHQAQNAALALAAVETFMGAAEGKSLDADLVRAGFSRVTSPGRLERVRTAPPILLDAAHNPHGMAATIAAVESEFAFRRLVVVTAILEDKDAAAMLEVLEPVTTDIVVTRNTSPRAMPLDRLVAVAEEIFGPDRVSRAGTMADAIELAVNLAESDMDTELGSVGILITGSVVTVADARRLLAR